MKITLFHFTCFYHLPVIKDEGLSRGDVPLTYSGQIHSDGMAVNLTDNPAWNMQSMWTTGTPPGAQFDKSGVRIEVELDTDDPKLTRWTDETKARLASLVSHPNPKERELHETFYAKLEKGAGHHWWIYRGTIPVNQFKKVEINPKLQNEWHKIHTKLTTPIHRGRAIITAQWPIPEHGVSREDTHRAIIDFYLSMVKECSRVDEFDIMGNQGLTIREEKESLGYLYEALHDSRIFEFTAHDYQTLFHTTDVYTCEQVYGEKWEPIPKEWEDAPPPLSDEDYEKYKSDGPKMRAAIGAIPMPSPLPFPNTYIAWGGGARLSHNKFRIQSNKALEPDVGAWAMSSLLTERGYVYSFMVYARILTGEAAREHIKRMSTNTLMKLTKAIGNNEVDEMWVDHTFRVAVERHPQRGWMVPTSMASWMMNMAVDAINQCDRLVAERPMFSTRMRLRDVYREIRKAPPPPPPYYKILLKPETFDARVNALFTRERHVDWSHRWDVRSHDLIKIMRGTLPIEPKLYHRLLKRKYELFDSLHPVSAECMTALMKRSLPPLQPGEWLAYHKGRVKSYVKGPQDKPYVPSSRALANQIPETIKSA